MRFLLDTNILIHREDNREVPAELQKLLRLINQIGGSAILHPESIREIERDRDTNRKEIVKSKILSYPFLEKPSDYSRDDGFMNVVGKPSTPNDHVDNALLYAVVRNSVDYLVTEDIGIHKKASRLNVKERVLSIGEARQRLQPFLPSEIASHPSALKVEFVYNLNVKDVFFDSLRQEYPEFNDWFENISREARQCWVYQQSSCQIGALLIRKIEIEAIDAVPPLPKKKRLKLSTFKVESTGYKIGELFIKLAVQYCIENSIGEIYLTHFTQAEDTLVDLLVEYGFSKIAKNPRGEDVFLKEVLIEKQALSGASPLTISKHYWPSFCDGPNVTKFIVPIRPAYHDRLFVELKELVTLFEMAGQFIVEGNTIRKAYLCHSRIKGLSPGTLLLFYRSQRKQAITSIGITEDVLADVDDKDAILNAIEKRTVYSEPEINEMLKKHLMIILFTWHFYLKFPVTMEWMRANGILSAPPQSILKIPHDSYLKIKAKGGLDERFTIN